MANRGPFSLQRPGPGFCCEIAQSKGIFVPLDEVRWPMRVTLRIRDYPTMFTPGVPPGSAPCPFCCMKHPEALYFEREPSYLVGTTPNVIPKEGLWGTNSLSKVMTINQIKKGYAVIQMGGLRGSVTCGSHGRRCGRAGRLEHFPAGMSCSHPMAFVPIITEHRDCI
jgi:hypothetical protein